MMRSKVCIPKLRNHQECRLFIGGYPYLTADPEFSINMIDTSMISVEDKHLQTIGLSKGYGEWQFVAEILACSDENMRQARVARDQTIYVIHVAETSMKLDKVSAFQ
ncbi:hypothetical protein RhiirC2_353776 [Rhizophagus irregularis]|uniref:Uncharacterized protein n=1 Tax=Rhizophagus irregularis TaxID=588596 RepID=A0A2N1NGS7_9GLOM|nr:hypothetical protein RhiirC2_353776 [Rhizophagus irregularis]